MHKPSTAAILAASFSIAACGGNEEAGYGPLSDAPSVPLVNASGEIIGEVQGGDGGDGAVLLVQARGLTPGTHGMHIHEIGICEPPSFESAGAHWNPTGRQHGGQNPQGSHMGDLENVTVGDDGRLRAQIVVPGTYLRAAGRESEPGEHQILDASGAALVIHAQPDDYRTDPSGNAGARVACAVLGAPEAGALVSPEQGRSAQNQARADIDGTAEAAGGNSQ